MIFPQLNSGTAKLAKEGAIKGNETDYLVNRNVLVSMNRLVEQIKSS